MCYSEWHIEAESPGTWEFKDTIIDVTTRPKSSLKMIRSDEVEPLGIDDL